MLKNFSVKKFKKSVLKIVLKLVLKIIRQNCRDLTSTICAISVQLFDLQIYDIPIYVPYGKGFTTIKTINLA